MSHLTREELVAWRDKQPGVDRERVLAHLGGCRPCTAAYAELVRTAPADDQPVYFKPEDFVQRGYAARKSAGQTSSSFAWASWKVWGGALAAAAAVILVVTLNTGPKPDDSAPERGSRIELVTPAAVAGQPLTLAWTTGLNAPRFTVVVTDASGAEIYRDTVTARTVTLPADAGAKLRPGASYTWTVTARDALGEAITAASGTFVASARSR